MNSLKHTKILLVIILFTLISCNKDSTSKRPAEPTLPLPVITSDLNQLRQWDIVKPLWNSLRAWHYNPEMVQPLWDVWEALAKPPLSLRMKIMIALVTDSRNRCPYCLSSAVCWLLDDGLSKDKVIELQKDITISSFSEREKTLLILAEKITLEPSSAYLYVGPALEAGWKQSEVAQAIFVSSYFNMLNRISESFAYPPDEEHVFDSDPQFPVHSCRSH